MTQPVDLSIVIVNYNGGELVDLCMASLRQHPLHDLMEVIVLDNGSTDGSAERIEKDYEQVVMVRLGANLGLAKAFNEGIRLSSGRYIMSLDNDTEVLDGSLDALVEFLDAHPQVGVAGSRLLNPDLSIQQTARRFPHPLNALFGRRSWLTKWFPNNPISRRYLMPEFESSEEPYCVDWVSTAALVARREVIEKVGGLDEGFFVYWVDADWCYRVNKGGWEIYCVPASKVIHNENLKAGRRDKRRTRMIVDFHKGVYRYYRKHYLRYWWTPMGLVTLAGLGTRVLCLLAADEMQRLRKRIV